MIYAKELRIGNIINFQKTDCFVHKIEAGDFGSNTNVYIEDQERPIGIIEGVYNYKINGYPDYVIDPIELTEKWLNDFGFNRDGSYMSHIFMNLTVEENKFGEEIILIPNQKYCKELKYVHQLQNLFFALTGKELEIND